MRDGDTFAVGAGAGILFFFVLFVVFQCGKYGVRKDVLKEQRTVEVVGP